MANRNTPLDDELRDYLVAHSARETPAQKGLREATRSQPAAGMQIGPEQAQFLGLLAKLIGARRTIEIGVFTGYSALAVAQALPEDGRVLACDISDAQFIRFRNQLLKNHRTVTKCLRAGEIFFADARRVNEGIGGVHADRDAIKTGILEGKRHIGEEVPIRGDGKVEEVTIHAAQSRQVANKIDQPTSQKRFPACESDLADSKRNQNPCHAQVIRER